MLDIQRLVDFSVIRLQIDPGTVEGDGGSGRASVQEQPWRQELRRGGQVSCDFLLEDRAGDFVDDAHPDG